MRHTLAAVLAALAVSLALPAPAAEPGEPSEKPGELTDAPYRCTDDVPEADFGLVEMACEEPQGESMLMTASSLCCSDCKTFASGWTCVFVYHCNATC